MIPTTLTHSTSHTHTSQSHTSVHLQAILDIVQVRKLRPRGMSHPCVRSHTDVAQGPTQLPLLPWGSGALQTPGQQVQWRRRRARRAAMLWGPRRQQPLP